MENDSPPNQPYVYDFLYSGGINYEFRTVQGINYRISLRSTDYLFVDIADISANTFEFILTPVFIPDGQKPALDNRVALTVATIFRDFYQQRPNTVILYICDSSDGKQNAKERKFSNWFGKYKGDEFQKINVVLMGSDETDAMLFSVIFKKANPYRNRMVDSLEKLKRNYRFGK